MYPVLFRIGTFEVTSFGVMLVVAALVGLWLFRRESQRSGLPLDVADAGIVGVVGGLLGAKLLWTLEHVGEGAVSDLLLSRGGLSWYGGLIGGVSAGLAYILLKGWSILSSLSAATPALAFGHLSGRIGCFLVGDDYGVGRRTCPGQWRYLKGCLRLHCQSIPRSSTKRSGSGCSGGGCFECDVAA
jgi:phosphatidylglycerol---prolipoprotein diacylglyceryl transferase